MTDYAMFANARTYVHVRKGELAAKVATAAADVLGRMSPGEYVVPLYESAPAHGEDELRVLGELADKLLHCSVDELLVLYTEVAGGVPYLLKVVGPTTERADDGEAAVIVPIDVEELPTKLSSKDFLRMRALSVPVASQFKGLAPQRPIQEVSRSLVTSVRAATEGTSDSEALFRSLSLVEWGSPEKVDTVSLLP